MPLSTVGTIAAHPNRNPGFPLLLLASFFVATAQAQPPPPSPLPNLDLRTDGTVLAAAIQPDGGLVIGGRFSEVDGLPRYNLARLQPDGSIDTAWNPMADDSVNALVADSSGAIYAAGHFIHINGVERFFLAKLSGSGSGGVDSQWHPFEPGAAVEVLALGEPCALYAGGSFEAGSSNDGRNLANLVKLSCSSGDPDRDWNPAPDGEVRALALDHQGDVYIGGRFVNVGSQPREGGLAKVAASGVGDPDPAWNPAGVGTQIGAIAADGSANVFVGGWFCARAAPTDCRPIAKLSGSGAGSVDDGWNATGFPPDAGILMSGLQVDGTTAVVAAGEYQSASSAEPTPFLVKLAYGDGSVDAGWSPSFNHDVYALAIGPDGSTYIGGDFDSVNGLRRYALTRVSATGEVEGLVTDAYFPGIVNAIARQPGGGMIVGGDFSYDTADQSRLNILRLEADGSLDPQWNPQADAPVRALVASPSGSVYVGGSFATIGGRSRNFLAKLAGDGVGAADPDWDPSPGGGLLGIGVDALALGSRGDVYVGGDFVAIGGQSQRYGLAKVAGEGTGDCDPQWLPLMASPVTALAMDAAGDVYVAGDFFFVPGGPPRSEMAKVAGDGSGAIDPDWDAAPDGPVYSIAVDEASVVYAGGAFTEIGGQSRTHLARLSGVSGAADPAWVPALATSNGPLDRPVGVAALALDGVGNLYAGGDFSQVDDLPIRYLARFSTSGTGAADANWTPSPNNDFRDGTPASSPAVHIPVRALAVDAGRALYIGGDFSAIGEQQRNGLAKLPPADLPDHVFGNGFD